ncbi:MAG: MBOAT family protein [Alphaproteobacteria bacterium]|nr:MBOAT family protein [Alphaproteobacteria bacterium]
MLFHEPVFLYAFLPATLAAYLVLRRGVSDEATAWLLLLASLVFYGWWDPRLVPLLLASIILNHRLGARIAADPRTAAAGRLLVLGVAINLGVLGLFKYTDFIVETANLVAGAQITRPGLPLPLGISFFTFLQIAFLVDCRQRAIRQPGLRDYALFVAYFPHLIAGPLVHHSELIPQFRRRAGRDALWENLAVGATIFVIGLAKKTLLAQPAADYADRVFNTAAAGGAPSLLEAWIGTLAFTFQIYFDFSAYSDMAIGLSRLFGIWLPVNFASPYKATSIIDFWRRWHITLSRFLRDYLYVALGGNRRGVARRYANVMIVMLLGGLWHGAGWTFVIWGGLHGAFLAINHAWRDWRGAHARPASAAGRWVGRLLTFLTVTVLWVPFRADGLATTISLWRGLVGLNGVVLPEHYAAIGPLVALAPLGVRFAAVPLYGGGWQLAELATALAIVWLLPNTQEILRGHAPALNFQPPILGRLPAWRPGALMGLATGLFAAFLFARTLQKQPGEFIYFQF